MKDLLDQIQTPELRAYSERFLRVALLQEEKNAIEKQKLAQEQDRLNQEQERLRLDTQRNDLILDLKEEVSHLSDLAQLLTEEHDENYHQPMMAAIQDLQYHILLVLKTLDLVMPTLLESQAGNKAGKDYHSLIQQALESNRLLMTVNGAQHNTDTRIQAGRDLTMDGVAVGQDNQVISRSSSGSGLIQSDESDVSVGEKT